MKDALTLLYDIPVDRIAANLLRKAPWWAQLPNFEKDILIDNTPRIRTQDVIDILKEPPWRQNQPLSNQIPDHRGKTVGCYKVLGFADCSDGTYKPMRCPSAVKRGQVGQLTVHRQHFWWAMEPDGTVKRIGWYQLRRLLPGETVSDMIRRRIIARGDQYEGSATTGIGRRVKLRPCTLSR